MIWLIATAFMVLNALYEAQRSPEQKLNSMLLACEAEIKDAGGSAISASRTCRCAEKDGKDWLTRHEGEALPQERWDAYVRWCGDGS